MLFKPLHITGLFHKPLKSEKLWFFSFFRGSRKGTVKWNSVIQSGVFWLRHLRIFWVKENSRYIFEFLIVGTQNFLKDWHFIPPETSTNVCVSGEKKYYFYKKFCIRTKWMTLLRKCWLSKSSACKSSELSAWNTHFKIFTFYDKLPLHNRQWCYINKKWNVSLSHSQAMFPSHQSTEFQSRSNESKSNA